MNGLNTLHTTLDEGDEAQLEAFLTAWPAVLPILAAVADGEDDEVVISTADSEYALEALQSLGGSRNGELALFCSSQSRGGRVVVGVAPARHQHHTPTPPSAALHQHRNHTPRVSGVVPLMVALVGVTRSRAGACVRAQQ